MGDEYKGESEGWVMNIIGESEGWVMNIIGESDR